MDGWMDGFYKSCKTILTGLYNTVIQGFYISLFQKVLGLGLRFKARALGFEARRAYRGLLDKLGEL